jgi:predicted Zn-ribbon and HTH transcriptional regulator
MCRLKNEIKDDFVKDWEDGIPIYDLILKYKISASTVTSWVVRLNLTKRNLAKTQEQFKEVIFNLVGDEYSVLGKYDSKNINIFMRHNVCGYEWMANHNEFINNSTRCPQCAGNVKRTQEQFCQEVYDLVRDKYSVLSNYINTNTKVEFIHNIPECGYRFPMSPVCFISVGHRCPKCAKNIKKTTEQFKQEVFDLVGNEYEVLGEYINTHIKILFKHNICNNEYPVSPHDFLDDCRCPICNRPSKGEESIRKNLEEKNISHLPQYKISECKNINPLPFDFGIFPNNNLLLVEFQGQQHYEPVDFAGRGKEWAENQLKLIQHNDQIKQIYCSTHNIPLLIIPYWDIDNIPNILNNFLINNLNDNLNNYLNNNQQYIAR